MPRSTTRSSGPGTAARSRDPYKICTECGCRNYKRGRRCEQCRTPYSQLPPLFPMVFVTMLVGLVAALFVVK